MGGSGVRCPAHQWTARLLTTRTCEELSISQYDIRSVTTGVRASGEGDKPQRCGSASHLEGTGKMLHRGAVGIPIEGMSISIAQARRCSRRHLPDLSPRSARVGRSCSSRPPGRQRGADERGNMRFIPTSTSTSPTTAATSTRPPSPRSRTSLLPVLERATAYEIGGRSTSGARPARSPKSTSRGESSRRPSTERQGDAHDYRTSRPDLAGGGERAWMTELKSAGRAARARRRRYVEAWGCRGRRAAMARPRTATVRRGRRWRRAEEGEHLSPTRSAVANGGQAV